MHATLLFRYTNLLIVETRGEREHASARIQREHVVRPVGDEHVAQLAVGPLGVDVRRDDLTHAAAPGHVLRDVEWISRALEGRRVVIGVGNLRRMIFWLVMKRYINRLRIIFLSHRPRVDDEIFLCSK